jgi:hypothetical protein
VFGGFYLHDAALLSAAPTFSADRITETVGPGYYWLLPAESHLT